MMIVFYLLVRRAGMPPGLEVIRDDDCVIVRSRDMDASRSAMIRDDGIVIAGSRDRDASLTGVLWMIPFLARDRFCVHVVRDDSHFICWSERHGCFSDQRYHG
jgi:hypothetical protein